MLSEDQVSQLEDYRSELEQVLGELPGYMSIEIEGDNLAIHMSGTLDSHERASVIDAIRDLDCLKALDDWGAHIVDNGDRLHKSDGIRRNLERRIQVQVTGLLPSEGVGVNDIDHVRLRFDMWSRMMRLLGKNAQGYVLKVTANPDAILHIRNMLEPIGIEHCIPIKVRGTNIIGSARDAARIENNAHHS